MQPPLRIGAVSYLNTKPLVHGLRERLGHRATLSFNLPSRLADDLHQGKLDVALIPSIEYLGDPSYQIVSNAVIACRGPVWSVRLLSRVPAQEIRRLALDEGSRTSAALVQVLLWEMYQRRPEIVPLRIDQSPERVDADAVLMIGDRAMHPPPRYYREIWDLGDRWCRHCELPFVFALWIARSGIDASEAEVAELSQILQASRDQGIASLEQIAEREAASHGLTKEDLHRYFAENLHYTLGPGEKNGLAEFDRRARSLDLIPHHAPPSTKP
ncbi:menaquinone biosynthetic enzyme MqnA/MqnD family protein [Novipirellula artificiosorum]|uniref:Chorismate dehydratase n=1 Tax=Novipirellula artificiosorum TaxID=2528016 RepID=A0A5C6DJW9_9BACT|nr:menaquinone biosynthesis protein [Novipirellula artificiosorum]TWU36207.1 Chorismate dehydratase [Novipirellula artificiosorum]